MKDELSDLELSYFKNLDAVSLVNLLENEKKVFWINLYNGLIQNELLKINGQKVDKSIFSKKVVVVGGEALSFDQIEHGIVRGNFWKYGLGFLPGQYLNKQTNKWKCKRLDSRIHFQLNCGAASCPMIRVLTLDNLEQELAWGESDYIINESNVDEKKQHNIFIWFISFLHKRFWWSKRN